MRTAAATLILALIITSVAWGQEAAATPLDAPSIPAEQTKMSNDDFAFGALFEAVNKAGNDKDNEIATPLKILAVFTILAVLPSLLVMTTSFTRIVIVLGFVRRALTTQTIPPTSVIVGLALFLTLFTMAPTLSRIDEVAVKPYLADDTDFRSAVDNAGGELKLFMTRHVRPADLALFVGLARIEQPETAVAVPMHVMVPAFVISELRTAFEMGFLLYIPFIVVDLVIASILLSTGMMMLPPILISMPFKIMLFILVDGWHLIARALAMSFM